MKSNYKPNNADKHPGAEETLRDLERTNSILAEELEEDSRRHLRAKKIAATHSAHPSWDSLQLPPEYPFRKYVERIRTDIELCFSNPASSNARKLAAKMAQKLLRLMEMYTDLSDAQKAMECALMCGQLTRELTIPSMKQLIAATESRVRSEQAKSSSNKRTRAFQEKRERMRKRQRDLQHKLRDCVSSIHPQAQGKELQLHPFQVQ